MKNHTEETEHFDYSDRNIQNILKKIDANYIELSEHVFSLKAYQYVRDNWLYSPNRISLIPKEWKASVIATKKSGHCIEKAILYISLLRSQKIPAKLGLAKVRNHILVDEILAKFGADVLVPHGYVSLYLHENWVKATPAFNASLCQKLCVEVLEFDGKHDSLFQQYNKDGSTMFMEYLEDYGTFDDIPFDFMLKLMLGTYPRLAEKKFKLGETLDLMNL